MKIRSQIHKALDTKIRGIEETCKDKQTYFYVISSYNQGWGVVVPEILGVLKHSIRNRYEVIFIGTQGNHTETIKLFDIGKKIRIYETGKLYEDSGLQEYKNILNAAISQKQLFHQYEDNFSELKLEMEIPDFHWPFGDLLKVIVHSTEFVHPDFQLNRCNMALFEQITVEGMKGDREPINLIQSVQTRGQEIFENKKLPFVLSVREAPKTHGGINRNTTPEGLHMMLEGIKNYTDEIELVGTAPTKELRKVLNEHGNKLKVNDFTFKEYESTNIDRGGSLDKNHVIQTYLLATKSVKLLCENGIIVIPQAAGQVQGLFDAENIFQPHLEKAIVVPKGYQLNNRLCASKSLLMNILTEQENEWIESRVTMKQAVVESAIENLIQLTEKYSKETIEKVSTYKPRLLQGIRRELIRNPELSNRLGYQQFGNHLVQDAAGKAVRFN